VFYPDGGLKLLFNYENGKEEGKCYLYDSDSQLIEERMYENGILKSYGTPEATPSG
jgi:antitoxin component YwqK of YwqJK toxin-antitoxin module